MVFTEGQNKVPRSDIISKVLEEYVMKSSPDCIFNKVEITSCRYTTYIMLSVCLSVCDDVHCGAQGP